MGTEGCSACDPLWKQAEALGAGIRLRNLWNPLRRYWGLAKNRYAEMFWFLPKLDFSDQLFQKSYLIFFKPTVLEV